MTDTAVPPKSRIERAVEVGGEVASLATLVLGFIVGHQILSPLDAYAGTPTDRVMVMTETGMFWYAAMWFFMGAFAGVLVAIIVFAIWKAAPAADAEQSRASIDTARTPR